MDTPVGCASCAPSYRNVAESGWLNIIKCMPEYRRYLVQGGTYFFTVITYDRLPFLTEELSRAILHDAWQQVNQRFPFRTDAVCLLPDHIHCIWTLPDDDQNYSVRWEEIKRIFSMNYRRKTGYGASKDGTRMQRRENAIWQRRFWEHLIRDEQDMKNHLDYIHSNPVKHGLVQDPIDWPWSSYHRYLRMGFYESGFGKNDHLQMDEENSGE